MRWRRRVACVVAAALVVGGLLTLASPVGAIGSAPPVSRTFTVRLQAPGPMQPYDLSCPTIAVCTVVGGDATGHALIYRTVDAGATWSAQTAPSATSTLHYVSCPTVSFCLAEEEQSFPTTVVEPTFIATTDGGVTWTQVGSFYFVGETAALSCPSRSSCYLVGTGQVFHSADGGASWAALSSTISSDWYPSRISCVTATTCAIAAVDWTDVGGAMTSSPYVVWVRGMHLAGSVLRAKGAASIEGLTGISCTTKRTCVTIGWSDHGERMFSTTDTTSWASHTLPLTIEDSGAISCPDPSSCSVIVQSAAHVGGLLVASTTDGGRSWRVTRVSWENGQSSITCPGRSSCYATSFYPSPSGSVAVAIGAHAEWHTSDLQSDTFGPLDAVACPSAATCIGLDSPAPLRSVNGGAAWTPVIGAPLDVEWTGIACPSTQLCLASAQGDFQRGPSTFVLRSTDAGSTWSQIELPRGNQSTSAIACPSVSICLVTSDDTPVPPQGGYAYSHYFRTTDGGLRWQRLRSLEGFSSVACGSTSDCIAVSPSGGVWISATAGLTWTATDDLHADLASVACASSTTCLASAASDGQSPLFETTDGGSSWVSIVAAQHDVTSLGCAGGTCWFVEDQHTLMLSVDGGAWSASALPSQLTVLAVAVLSSGTLAVVGEDTLAGASVATSP